MNGYFIQVQKLPKIVLALLIQILSLLIIGGVVYGLPFLMDTPYFLMLAVSAQGFLAATLSCRMGLPCWWRWIQFFMPIGLYVGVVIDFNPIWALAFFGLIWLFFANAITERVPLYFTNETTRVALKQLVADSKAVRFLDLGCGFGANVAFMASLPQVEASHGVETAPLPYLISKVLTIFKGGRTYALDLWKTDLAYYDVVYAFLSPEPMPKLWLKVQAEMQPGSVFVSNSFAVPGVEVSEIWTLDDGRETQLYLYRIT